MKEQPKTFRDELATAALPFCLDLVERSHTWGLVAGLAAQRAYEVADAMLAWCKV